MKKFIDISFIKTDITNYDAI